MVAARASGTMISISIWMVVMTMRENYIVKKKQSTEWEEPTIKPVDWSLARCGLFWCMRPSKSFCGAYLPWVPRKSWTSSFFTGVVALSNNDMLFSLKYLCYVFSTASINMAVREVFGDCLIVLDGPDAWKPRRGGAVCTLPAFAIIQAVEICCMNHCVNFWIQK